MIWFERKVTATCRTASARTGPGPFGHPPDPRRRHQALLQGGPACPTGPTGASSAWRRTCRSCPAFLVFARRARSAATSPASSDGAVELFGHDTYLQLADPPIGILLVLAMSSIAVYGVMLAGWSSGSKYPLLGSVRASAQMVSYEAALGLSVVAVVLLAGSLSHPRHRAEPGRRRATRRLPRLEPHRHRRRAVRHLPHRRHRRAQPAAVRPRRGRAGARRRLPHRVQLDPLRPLLPGRVHEHGHDVGDHRHAVPRRPGRARRFFGPDWIWGPIWFFVKLLVFLFMFVWFRATLPRFRYDQLMDLGWKVLIPLALGWLLLLAASASPATRTGTPASSWPVGFVGDRRRRYAAAHRAPSRTAQRRREPSRRGGVRLMGYLDGFAVTFRQDVQGHRAPAHRHRPVREGRGPKRDEAGAPPRPPRPQPLRGRHGEVHRVRAVRRRVPGPLHLRARRRQPARRPGLAGRALRLRLRDQLPALHPLRPVRRGLPDRGDHRVEAVRVLLHQPARTPSTRRPSCWSTTTAGPSSCRGRTGPTSTRSPPQPRRGCGPPPPSGDADYDGQVAWSGELGFGVQPAEQGQTPPDPEPERRRARRPTATTTTHDARRAPLMETRRLRRRPAASCSAAPSASCSTRNPVHAALSLVATLFGIAVLFVAQEAHFLAAVQVIVYAGAIVVLFLFVIMLLGVDQAEDLATEPLGGGQRIAAVVVGLGDPRPAAARRLAPPTATPPARRPGAGDRRPHRRRRGRRRPARRVALHRLPLRLRDHLACCSSSPSSAPSCWPARSSDGRPIDDPTGRSTTRPPTTERRGRGGRRVIARRRGHAGLVPRARRRCSSPSAPSACSCGATRW